ncbi:MAG: hypothetical protein JNM51_13645 [Bacteroidia bacterium]|nr:hypothetical protein [Bacteroidia bacterium]
MKKILLIYFTLTCSLIFGQETKLKNNAAYLEFLGNGGSWVSVNYERIIHYTKTKYIHNTIRIGFSWSTNRWDKSPIYSFPIELNTLIGENHHFIELGVGLTPFIGTSNLNDTIIPYDQKSNYTETYFIRLGYRYMGKGVVFRVAPLLGYVRVNQLTQKRNAILGFGISIGGVFNFRKTHDINDAYSN